jgi:hypothetical protein
MSNEKDANPDGWLATLHAMVEAQRAVLGQLDALSLRQGALIDAGEGEALLVLLAEREAFVNDAVARAAAIDEHRASAPSLSGAVAHEVGVMLDGLAALARQVAERDAADARRLRDVQDRIAAEVAGSVKARSALSSYAPANEPAPRFQDTQG